jgi:hypothetical protein
VIIDGLNGGLKGKLREATKLVYGGLMWVYLTWIRGLNDGGGQRLKVA